METIKFEYVQLKGIPFGNLDQTFFNNFMLNFFHFNMVTVGHLAQRKICRRNAILDEIISIIFTADVDLFII